MMNARIAALFCGVAIPLTTPVMAADTATSDPLAAKAAPVSELVSKVEIPYSKFTLPNGLTVLVNEDHKAPVVAVSVWYNVGSRNEPAGKTGYAHLFEHIMFYGSQHAPGSFFGYLDRIGATDWNGTTWYDRTNYFETVPRAALDAALFLEADRMGYLLGGLTRKTLDTQIGVVSNEKRQDDNQPYGLVQYVQADRLFPAGHPYHHTTIGSLDDLKAASLDDVKGWFTNHYAPNNAILVLSGDITRADAERLVGKYFGPIARGPQVAPVTAPLPTTPVDTVVMKDDVPTTRIIRDWVVPGRTSPQFAALETGAAALGGLATSRLDRTLVRGAGLAVSASAGIEPHQLASVMEVTVDVKPGVDVATVRARLDDVIHDLVANGPTAAEVRQVATNTAAGRIASLESAGGFGGRAVALAEGQLYAHDPEFYKHRLDEYAAMTPAKVKAALNRYMATPGFTIIVEPGTRTEYKGGTPTGAAAPVHGVARGPAHFLAAGDSPAPGGAGAGADPLPPIGKLAKLDYPDVRTATLSNGIKVYVARRSTVPIVNVSVRFDAGYAADPRHALGTASMMTTMLTEGTTSRDALQILGDEEALGAQINAGSDLDHTGVNLRAVTPNLAPALDLLADVIEHPAFPEKNLERVRIQRLTEIKGEYGDPAGIARRTITPVIYGAGHPYAVPLTGTGDPAAVAKLTRGDLAAFHNAWIRPEKASIYVVGDTTMAAILPLLEARFGHWHGEGAAAPAKVLDAPVPAPQPRIILIDRPNSPQSLIIGAEVTNLNAHDDRLAVDVANDVLGGGTSSRLFVDLRDTKGWSYGAGSFLNVAQGPMPFLVYAPVQIDRTGDSIKELQGDLSAYFGPQGASGKELADVVRKDTLSLAGDYETGAAVLGQMQADVDAGHPLDYVRTLPDRYARLDPAVVNSAIRAHIDPAKLVWIVVGDASKVGPQLAETGLPVDRRDAIGNPVKQP